jgi:hypothetical protein
MSSISIKCIPECINWQAIPNSLAQDYRLSAGALGLAVECLSRPADWINYPDFLVKRRRMKKGTISSYYKELTNLGYAHLFRVAGKEGTFGSMYVISPIPLSSEEWKEFKVLHQGKKITIMTNNPHRVSPYSGSNPGVNKHIDLNNKHIEHVFKQTDNLPTEDNPSGFPFQESNLPTPNKKDDKGKQLRLTDHSSPAHKLAEYQALSLLKCYPDRKLEKERTLQKWAKEYQRALSKDEKDYNEIVEVIDFVMSPFGWSNDRFSAGAIVRKFDILLEEAKLKRKKYDVREKDPELSKLLINYWGQFTGQATSTEEWKPSSEVLNDLIQIANNLYVAYKGSPIQDKWTWITTFGKFLESEYKNKGIVPRLSVLLKPMVWENDFPIWKQINNIL